MAAIKPPYPDTRPRFKVGDVITSAGYEDGVTILELTEDGYVVSENGDWVSFWGGDKFWRLHEETIVDRILTKYTNEVASS